MKTRQLFLLMAMLFLVTACQKKEASNTTLSESLASSEVTIQSTIISSDIDDTRKTEPTSDVAKLRRQLYEAGVNSSTLTDEVLTRYEQEAKKQNEDVIDYIKKKLDE